MVLIRFLLLRVIEGDRLVFVAKKLHRVLFGQLNILEQPTHIATGTVATCGPRQIGHTVSGTRFGSRGVAIHLVSIRFQQTGDLLRKIGSDSGPREDE